MMSYLWILLLGSLLASHAKAQDVTEAPDDVDDTDKADDDNPATVAPTANSQSEPDADPEVVEVTPAPSDSEETTPSEDAEPTVAGGVGEATENPAEADPETPAADPEADVPTDAEITTPAVPVEEDTETKSPTPGEALIVTTTVAEEALTTQGAGSGVIEAEPEEKEVPSTTLTPADPEMIGGDMKTTPAPKDEQTTSAPLNMKPEVETNDASEPDTGAEFNLENALISPEEDKGKSRSLNQAPVINASEGDKPAAQEGGSKTLAGILSAIVVSAVGAVSGYFAYQKKKLCFKKREEADPEAGHKTDKVDVAEAQSDPQVLSNLLNSSQQ